MVRVFFLLAAAAGNAFAQSHEFVRTRLLGQPAAAPVRAQMLTYLKRGRVQKDRIGGRLLRIKDREFERGVVMSGTGEIRVILGAPAASFEAVVGVDSNDLGYYSNRGRGGVEASVEIDGRQVFRSPYLKEGVPGVPVQVSLDGAREFALRLEAVGEKSRFYQPEWDQADWAMAKVKLADGSEIWLADLPVGPIETAPEIGLPFSFRYGGRPSKDVLSEWIVARESRRIDQNRTEYTITYSHPSAGVTVRAVAVEYHDFPAVEWTLHFRNTGSSRSPMIEDIQALDTSFARGGEGEFLLHHGVGGYAKVDAYMPLQTPLGPKVEKQLASVGGRASDGDLPYFNLERPGGGVVVAVGWPGQWAARFIRDEGRSVQVRAGQELTHFRLEPGEDVRSPLIALVFYEGDWIAGQNTWRRWMVAHNLPRPGGELHPPHLAEGSARQTVEMQEAHEADQILRLTRELDRGVPLDYWWMDAGWYPMATDWSDTGTWEPDHQRFPKGLAPIAEAAHQLGVKTIVWFEPERVRAGTWLDQTHPEWLLSKPDSPNRLLDLGNDQAREWLTEHVSRLIREQGIDLYRQDFNFEPLPYWRAKDAPDRQGITEIKHVTGYLAYWDELHRRFPNMTIDSCSSGGRRNDLETLRRAIPLTRSDKLYEPIAMQAMSYGISLWMPYYGSSINSVEPYAFRSQMAPAIMLGLVAGDYPDGYDRLKELIAQWRRESGNYNGDYYPLTPYSLDVTAWMAWQFNLPEKGEGMVQVFRRPESPFEMARFRLRGLDSKASYVVKNMDDPAETTIGGAELMESGLPVTLKQRPGAAVISYRRR